MANQIPSWTNDEVKSLNEYQQHGYGHPFTCGRKSHTLVARNNGWYCPECEKEGFSYTQGWAWEWMMNWEWKKMFWPFDGQCSEPPVQKPPAGPTDTENEENDPPFISIVEPPQP